VSTRTRRAPQKTKHPNLWKLDASRRFPDGAWMVRYRDPHNATRRKTFATKEAALDFQASIRTDTRRGDYLDPKRASTTFAEVANAWRATLGTTRRPKTVAGYEQILDRHLLPEFGMRSVGRITTSDIEDFLLASVPAGSRKNVHNVMNEVCKRALKSQMLKVNPCVGVTLPKVARREMLALDESQVLQLAETITPWYRTLVLAAAYTGMRRGELEALRVRNVDLLGSRVLVRESVAQVNRELIYGPPKTEKGKRELSVPRFLLELLEDAMAGKGPDDFVLTGQAGGPLRHSTYYQRHYRPAVAQLVRDGVWPEQLAALRFHDLRHTHASILIRENVHPKVIADRLGHTSISTTLDIYGHLFPEQETALAAKLDEVFDRAQPRQLRKLG
jgi:integrase